MRTPLALVAAAFAVTGLLVFAPSASTAPPGLRSDQSVFWNGAFVDSGNVEDPALCDKPTPCPTYPLVLAEPGARLRVAIDTPSREDGFAVDVIDPKGVTRATTSNANQFNAEAFVEKPQAGTWKVRVRPVGATRAAFRMRAMLERAVVKPSGTGPLLPNLRAVPPYEFTFTAPANPLNGLYPPDTANPPLDVAGVHPVSCTADEAAPVAAGGAGAVRCLRLTSGPINVGAGPFDMRFTFVADAADGDLDPAYLRGPIFQAVHHADGKVVKRPAGAYIFHTTHAHFHDENILTYELFRADPATGSLKAAGKGVKSGFCPADQLFGEWERFVQQPAGYFGEGDTPTGNCFSPSDGLLGLTSGWGDVYRWQRPGQYVEFAGNTDGLFVVRTTVDKQNHILETDDSDNSAYAYIRVVGETVQILERGWGESPWDLRKAVFTGSGPASRR